MTFTARGAWALGSAVLLVLGGGTIVFAVHRASAKRAAEAAEADRARAAAERERMRKLQAGIDRFGEIKAELHAFGEWIRAVRPRILTGQTKGALGEVKCTEAKGSTLRWVTCSASHFPHGGPPGIRYQVLWYRDHPDDMRATASEVPYSPLVTCDTLGLRQNHRRTEDQGRVTILDCAVPDSTETYAVRHTVSTGSATTAVSWFSSGYLQRDQAMTGPAASW